MGSNVSVHPIQSDSQKNNNTLERKIKNYFRSKTCRFIKK